jgi:RHS repeat-associated protein
MFISAASILISQFTGKERDAETGLDYFLARYYSAAQGRFLSPDEFTGGAVDPFTGKPVGQPGPLPYADITNPQTLNKYAYVINNPLKYTDPDGHLFAPWHFAITLVAAAKTHHGFFGSLKLAWGSMWVDFRKGSNLQDAGHTNWHSMEGIDVNGNTQTKDEADAGTAQVVSEALDGRDTALAVHAVEDQAEPLHEGHQWTGMNRSYFRHLLGDLFPSPRTVENAYENAVKVLKFKKQTAAPSPGLSQSPDALPSVPYYLGYEGPQ